jgi:hypothetical protein
MTKSKSDKSELKRFFDFNEVFKYFFRKKKKDGKPDFNLRVMHGINRLSIIMFLLAIIFLILRNLF